jgi:hypothetical protein
LAVREEKLGDEENQALVAHTRKRKSKKEVHSHKEASCITKDSKV